MHQNIDFKDIFKNPHFYGTVGDLNKLLYGEVDEPTNS